MTSRTTAALVSALAASLATPVAVVAEDMPVGDVSLPYVSAGEGTPVVFVHGAISDMRVWEPYQAMISDDRRFVAYTQRYFGTGEWPEDRSNFQIATHVADLIAVVEGLDAGPVDLVTWSYSGEVGVRAMLARPELFRSAVHFEPTLYWLAAGSPGWDNATRTMFAGFGPAMRAVEEDRGEDAALRFIEVVFNLDEGAAVGEAGEEIWRQNGHTVAPYLAMDPGEFFGCAALSGVTAPTLVVQGERSYTRFSMMAERVASCLPNALIVTQPGVNHDGPYRQPEVFGGMIENFLSLVE